MIGVIVSAEPSLVRIRPAFIGWRSLGVDRDNPHPQGNTNHYFHPGQIDQFSEVDFGRSLSAEETRRIAACEESHVKKALLAILGEPYIDNDWGGERSDAYTTQVTLDGVHKRSAWLLKGKSVRRPMRIADLGKNGDQIDRLFTEPADLYVVQSNQKITSDVRNMLDVYAHDYRRPSRYTLLDGADTARILLTYGELPEIEA